MPAVPQFSKSKFFARLPDSAARSPHANTSDWRRGHLEKAELALCNAAWCMRFRPAALPRATVLELAAVLTAVARTHRRVRPPTVKLVPLSDQPIHVP